MKIHRKYAEIGFTIYFDISYETMGNYYHINNFELLGTEFEDEIKFRNMNNTIDDSCTLLKKNGGDCNTVISYDKNYKEKVEDYLETTKREVAISKENDLYRCFFKDSLNEQECMSFELIKKEGSTEVTKKTPGLWAKNKCTIDEECPYFKANQNYPNSRGGCVDGKCEMPIGVRLLTPTIASPDDKPYCHNCKKTNCQGLECLKCCDDQLNYFNMITPDYAFPNDINERLEYKDRFESRGYSPFKLSF